MREGAKKLNFPREKNQSPSEVYIKSDNRALFTSQRTFELVGGAWECQNKSFFIDKPNKLFILAVSGKKHFFTTGKKTFFHYQEKNRLFFHYQEKNSEVVGNLFSIDLLVHHTSEKGSVEVNKSIFCTNWRLDFSDYIETEARFLGQVEMY